MVVYCHTTTPRLQYVIDFFSRYYGIPFLLTTDRLHYLAATAPRINYSGTQVAAGEIHIEPHAILFEQGIRAFVPDVFAFQKSKALFKTGGNFPFDLFAGVFYLLSRYEEYLPHAQDSYGRYAHENALAFRENFLAIPLVDQWLIAFREMLVEKFPAVHFTKKAFQWIPTYDIDIAWSYQGKGFLRNAGGFFRDVSTGRLQQGVSRIASLLHIRKDPFDAHAWLQDFHKRYSLKAVFFFLVAEKRAQFDKNIDPANKKLQQLIRDAARQHTVGLHPSWQSGEGAGVMEKEKKFLEAIAGTTVVHSRQHFIRFTLPATYQRLVAAGIGHDYSMGYGSINGFRASVATPFFWYDLQNETTTTLMVHPFCFMDANSFYEQKQDAAATGEELRSLLQSVQSVNGTMYTIWHNHFLGTDPTFKGWRTIYEDFVRLVLT